jgi:hypothetical protein
MLILCCRAFLREQLHLAERGKLTSGCVAGTFGNLESWVCSRTAQVAASRHGLDWSEAFPVRELKKTFIPTLRHIPEWLESIPVKHTRKVIHTNGHSESNGHENGNGHAVLEDRFTLPLPLTDFVVNA